MGGRIAIGSGRFRVEEVQEVRELAIEESVTKFAKKMGWLSFKFTSPGNRGVPDRIYFKSGRTLLIEFKAPGKKPTKLQEHVINRLKENGIETHVVNCKETGHAIFIA